MVGYETLMSDLNLQKINIKSPKIAALVKTDRRV